MLELLRPSLTAIRCCGRPSALDLLSPRENILVGRIAPDELLLLVPTREAERLLAEIATELVASDSGALVIDHTDAFEVITISGAIHEAFARLTAIETPDAGFVQGLVADVPCKIFLALDHCHLLAPSTYADHVHERILVTCAELGVRRSTSAEPATLRSAAPA